MTNNICPLCGTESIYVARSIYYKDTDMVTKASEVFLCPVESCRNMFHGGVEDSD